MILLYFISFPSIIATRYCTKVLCLSLPTYHTSSWLLKSDSPVPTHVCNIKYTLTANILFHWFTPKFLPDLALFFSDLFVACRGFPWCSELRPNKHTWPCQNLGDLGFQPTPKLICFTLDCKRASDLSDKTPHNIRNMSSLPQGGSPNHTHCFDTQSISPHFVYTMLNNCEPVIPSIQLFLPPTPKKPS